MVSARDIRHSIFIGIIMLLLLFNPREISVPLVVLATVVSLAPRFARFSKTTTILWAVALASFFSPVDLDLIDPRTPRGPRGMGLRLVPVVTHLAHLKIRDGMLVEDHEYILGINCFGCPLVPPKWIVAWN